MYKNFPRKVVRFSFLYQNFEIICHPDVNCRNSNKNKVQAQNPWTTIRYTENNILQLITGYLLITKCSSFIK